MESGRGSSIDYSRELRHVAGIPTLEELTFSPTYLESIKFEDPGLEVIAALGASLRVLSLGDAPELRGLTLARFPKLEAARPGPCVPVDAGACRRGLGLTGLRRLLLRDATIGDEGLRNLRGLVNLEWLDLGGTRITDAGVANLRGMTRLKKLNCQGAALTDEGVRHLADLANLEELNLYGTKVTSTRGVGRVLRGLEHLTAVDLRYSRVTRAGVDRLRDALPRCRLPSGYLGHDTARGGSDRGRRGGPGGGPMGGFDRRPGRQPWDGRLPRRSSPWRRQT